MGVSKVRTLLACIMTTNKTYLLFDCVLVYQHFIEADNMEKNCEHLRVCLQIENARLQDWRKVSGLAAYKDGQDFPDSLKAHKLVLIAILTQIHTLLTDFAEINGRYEELQLENEGANQSTVQDQQNSALAEVNLSYSSPNRDMRHPRGLNHITRGLSMVKNVVSHPRRLRWVAFDQKVFRGLLGKLSDFNGYLQELLHGHEARALEAATQATFLQIVQLRTSVEDLKHLTMASILLNSYRASALSLSGNAGRRQDKALESLARFKQVRAANDEPDEQETPYYKSLIQSTEIMECSAISYTKEGQEPTATDQIRTEGEYSPDNQTTLRVWIEWKGYNAEYDEQRETDFPLENHVNRVKELVALLKAEKPSEFCTPKCLGYFDDRKDSEKSQNAYRFGLVYQNPRKDTKPISLRHLIRRNSMPPLSTRIQLAHKIATCILYLHAVNWLHKALRSENILVFPEGNDFDLEHPLVTGYEYARPDRDGETTTVGGSNAWWEIYAHPIYQGGRTKGHYRKSFDIYSLGIILLEIAYWKSIEKIMEIDPNKAPRTVLYQIRERLIAPDSKYVEYVSANLGDKYCLAVKSCLDARSAFGIGQNEAESNVHIGAKLQAQFTALVVCSLEEIRV